MFKNNYVEQDILDSEYYFNNNVNDCLIKMYIVMLTRKDDLQFEKKYNDFEKTYNLLNKEEQEYVKKEYTNIMNEKEEKNYNIKKLKIKKKGNDKYE